MDVEYRVKSDRNFEEACEFVRDVVSANEFGVLAEIKTGDILTSKGFEYPRMNTYEVCNPAYAHAVLTRDQRFESMLPCRIVVKAKGDGTEIIALMPEPLVGLVGVNSVMDVMKTAQKALIKMVNEIAQ